MDFMPGTQRFVFASAVLISFVMPQSSAEAQAGLGAQAASQIVEGCVAHARAKRQSQAIAVYDDGGHLVSYLRMDGNGPGVGDFAMQKGAAVAHWRFSTAAMANSVKETPGFAKAPHVVTVAGGIPVFSKDGKQ